MFIFHLFLFLLKECKFTIVAKVINKKGGKKYDPHFNISVTPSFQMTKRSVQNHEWEKIIIFPTQEIKRAVYFIIFYLKCIQSFMGKY